MLQVYVLVILRGGDWVVSGVVWVTTSSVVLSRATQVAYGWCRCNGVPTLGVLLVVWNLLTYIWLLLSNCICMTCEHVILPLLSYWALAHSHCFNVFQVPMMMPMLIDMIAWVTVQTLMDGMSESAESRLVFLLKSFVKAIFCVGLCITWRRIWVMLSPPLFQKAFDMYSFSVEAYKSIVNVL